MISLKIMTPDQGVCFESEVKYVDVNTKTGHIGLQKGITPMVAALKNSVCTIKKTEQEIIKVVICGGTLYVDKDKGIKIFTSSFAFLEDINEDGLVSRINLLQEQMKHMDTGDKKYVEIENDYLISKNILESIRNK